MLYNMYGYWLGLHYLKLYFTLPTSFSSIMPLMNWTWSDVELYTTLKNAAKHSSSSFEMGQ